MLSPLCNTKNNPKTNKKKKQLLIIHIWFDYMKS